MHLVGKILVVLQLVLSVLFMALAGVAYSTHISWRTEAEKQKKLAAERTKERDDKQAEFDRYKSEMTDKLKAATDHAGEVEATNKTLLANVAQVTKDRDDKALSQKTSAEQAQIAGEEAAARKLEADVLRKLNHEQAGRLDADLEEKTKLDDRVHSLELDLATARSKNKDLLARVSIQQQALEAAGITADASELAARNAPPPRLDGVILDSRPPKRQGASELVEISLGSDDGLKKGHQMSVYRLASAAGQQPRYLGKIVIVNTTPDKAVGQVIEGSRNGVIQKGDNVTTKL